MTVKNPTSQLRRATLDRWAREYHREQATTRTNARFHALGVGIGKTLGALLVTAAIAATLATAALVPLALWRVVFG